MTNRSRAARVYLRVSEDELDLNRQEAIRGRRARLAVPGIVGLSDLVADSAIVARIMLEAVQNMLLRLALQTARDDYETRRERQRDGIEIAKTAVLAGCSIAYVKRVTALHRTKAR